MSEMLGSFSRGSSGTEAEDLVENLVRQAFVFGKA